MIDEDLSDGFDPDESATQPDTFVSAKIGSEFNGHTLAPWSPSRKVAANCMGMLYPNIGDDGYEQLQRTGLYPGALKDVVIFIWLGSQPSEADILRAQRRPAAAWSIAQSWADKLGLLDLESAAFNTAYELFSAKMTAEQAARSKPDLPDEKGGALPKI